MEAFDSTSLFLVTNLPRALSHISETDFRPLLRRVRGEEECPPVSHLEVQIDDEARSAFVTVDSRGAPPRTAINVAPGNFHLGDSPVNVQQLCQETVSLELSGCTDDHVVRTTKSLAEKRNLRLAHVSEDVITVSGPFVAIRQLREDLRTHLLKAAAAPTVAVAAHVSAHNQQQPTVNREAGKLPAAKNYELDVDLAAEMPIVINGLNRDVLCFMANVSEASIEGVRYSPATGEVVITKPTMEEVELCRTKFTALYESLVVPSPNHVRATSVELPSGMDAESVIASMNRQHGQCVLYPEDRDHIKILSCSEEQLSSATKQLQSLLLVPSADTFSLQDGRRLTVRKGKIETESAGALVCPSNSRLQHTSGVAAQMNEASLGTLQKKSDSIIMQQREPLKVGNIVMVPGGAALKCKNVYLVILPDAHCGPKTSYSVVQEIVVKLLGYVEKHKIQFMVLPLFVSEVFFDKNIVAKLMVESIIDYKFGTKPPVLSDLIICVSEDADFVFLTRYLYQKKVERTGQDAPAIEGLHLMSTVTSGTNLSISDLAGKDITTDSSQENDLKTKSQILVKDHGVCFFCKRTSGAGTMTTMCCHQILCQDCRKKSTKLSNKCPLCKMEPEGLTVTYSTRAENDSLKFTDQLQYHHFKDYW